MRKITILAKLAFENNENFNQSNTIVKVCDNYTRLLLFNNEIACKNRITNEIFITNCGYFTNTTKERLNGLQGVNINQKKFVWYLNGKEWNGELTKIR